MEFNRLVTRICANAGRLMLENGAETHRVEDTMERISAAYGIKNAQSFVTLTGIFIACGSTTELIRVTKRGTNLGIVSAVNQLSREIVSGEIGIDTAIRRLDEIEKMRPYPAHIMTSARALSCFAFTYLYGGSLYDCINSLLSGIVLSLCIAALNRARLTSFLTSLVSGAVLALSSLLFYNAGIGSNVHSAIIGGLMPLLPGLGLTNAIRDIMDADYMCGSARLFDACTTALAVAVGVGSVLMLWRFMFGNVAI